MGTKCILRGCKKKKTGKNIAELFPNFSLFVFGGVNFAPYRKKFKKLIGKNVDSLELYPASEGIYCFSGHSV